MNEIFKKFYSRLKREGMLKAALCAAAVSFGVLAVTAFICWMTAFTPVWICPVTFCVSAGLSFTLFYFLMFRPDFKTVAARMDALGLDERMITMYEYADSASLMSEVQRTDAAKYAEKVSAKMLKICVSALIISIAAMGVAVGMTFLTVDTLSEVGVIKSGKELVEEMANPPVQYNLTYKVSGEGIIYVPGSKQRDATKDIVITVESGEQGQLVRSAPADGWFLAGWKENEDNYVMLDDYRCDTNVTESATITAVYEQLEAPVPDEGPAGPGTGGGSGGGGGGGGAGTGIIRPAGYVIDGNIHYKDTYTNDLADAMREVENNDSISRDEADIIGDFFNTIAP